MTENTQSETAETRSASRASNVEDDVWSRRSYIKYLAPISVAVPVVVEGRTLVGLLRQDFASGGSSYSKPTGVDVGIGGELRPDTPTRETLRNAAISSTSDGERLVLSAGVKNTQQAAYRFSLGAVTTDGGETVEGGGQTDPVSPGGTATVQSTYTLPADATPKSVDTTVTIGGRTSKKTVQLAPLPAAQRNE
ncbi:hypothetical protein [Halocalculus aciditolerans]|uniref:Uncharacterized protein n=1 Tax=Halocalculus aciditolerans TaxID=1383812 RepID=A0A830F969_9EURY|nr:hypothetical protein [Halocalculus aciditolerans]GGL66909.1 hypothetical protein GCM10009039_26120 [Halocalculus aciditolerans]